MTEKLKLLAVDDQTAIFDAIDMAIGDQVDMTALTNVDTAMALLEAQEFDVVLVDYNIDGRNGLDIFRLARESNPYVTVCLMTGDEAAGKMRDVFEAFNGLLIEKPFAEADFSTLLDRAHKDRIRKLERQPKHRTDDLLSRLVADSPSMINIIDRIRRLAPQRDLSIYMSGATGTGKTELAKAVHQLSGVKGLFKTVTCSAIPPELAYSTLFGHKKGSFTGANEDRRGLVDEANGGTLFLDELQLLPPAVQNVLLRVLDTGTYIRLGETDERQSKFRLITASSVDIRKLTNDGKFLPDLWYRISATTVTVPTLNERKACIPKLIYRFINEFETTLGRKFSIEPAALDLMISFSWSGNIRDLRNSVRNLCAECGPNGDITSKLVEADLAQRDGVFTGRSSVLKTGETLVSAKRRIEIELITNALKSSDGSIQKASSILQVPRQTLRSRILALGINHA